MEGGWKKALAAVVLAGMILIPASAALADNGNHFGQEKNGNNGNHFGQVKDKDKNECNNTTEDNEGEEGEENEVCNNTTENTTGNETNVTNTTGNVTPPTVNEEANEGANVSGNVTTEGNEEVNEGTVNTSSSNQGGTLPRTGGGAEALVLATASGIAAYVMRRFGH